LNIAYGVPNRPRRVAGFSYVGLHQYFLTICCDKRRRCFDDEVAATWLVSQIVQPFQTEHFEVIAYCVMPDHVHLLLEGVTDNADLRAAMHYWKQHTGFVWTQRTGRTLWQVGYYDYVLREDDLVTSIVKYIIGNPVRAGLVSDVSHYPHTGSSRYALEELADSVADWRPPSQRRV
jgi:putative transposase